VPLLNEGTPADDGGETADKDENRGYRFHAN
jgi:hypothetical protein